MIKKNIPAKSYEVGEVFEDDFKNDKEPLEAEGSKQIAISKKTKKSVHDGSTIIKEVDNINLTRAGQDVSRVTLEECITQNPEKKLWVCTACGKSNKQKHCIRMHIEAVHFPGRFLYDCTLCAKRFNGQNSANVHMHKVHRLYFFKSTKRYRLRPKPVLSFP